MTLAVVSTIGKLTARRTDEVFDSHTYVARPSEQTDRNSWLTMLRLFCCEESSEFQVFKVIQKRT